MRGSQCLSAPAPLHPLMLALSQGSPAVVVLAQGLRHEDCSSVLL